MKTKSSNAKVRTMAKLIVLLLAVGAWFLPPTAVAVGSWGASVSPAPGGLDTFLLLSDGTVMAHQGGVSATWYRLTPNNGSYSSGTWTTLTPMNDARTVFSSVVLRDGRVFVAGGEYDATSPSANDVGTAGGVRAEIFDPQANSGSGAWTQVNPPTSLLNPMPGQGFYDADCVLLSDGRVLIAPVGQFGGALIYDPVPVANNWSAGPSSKNQNEATWVKLPDNSILTIDPSNNPAFLNTSERFIPSLNNGQGGWQLDDGLPVPMYNAQQETGPGIVLPDGRAFFVGGNGQTVYYTPTATPGNRWTQGPNLPTGVGYDHAAAMMVNGKVLIQSQGASPATPQFVFYELDPTPQPPQYPVGKMTKAPDWPGGGDNSFGVHCMLALPDGNVLVCDGLNSTLHVYIPDSVPLTSGRPTITSVTANADGSYHLVGTRLNGNSQGASNGDENQSDSNYPLVRLTDIFSLVRYGRTFNWSSAGIMTGNTPVSTEFTIPDDILNGAITGPAMFFLQVVANGISSDAIAFGGPVWVDFNWNGAENGSFVAPYRTLQAALTAAASSPVIGRTIRIKGPSSSPERFTAPPISIPVTIISSGGPATIGN